MKKKPKKPRESGAPLGPNDPGFYGNAADPAATAHIEPSTDTMGRPLRKEGET